MIRLPQSEVLGVPFTVCTYADVLAWLRENQGPGMVAVANVADVMTALREPVYAAALRAADLVVPDGMPIVWALRADGHPLPDRVYGPDLMAFALQDPVLQTRRHVLVGASEAARAGVRQRFPAANWVGEADPQFAQLERGGGESVQRDGVFIPGSYADLADWLHQVRADVVWIALGGGRQVQAMARLQPLLRHGVMLGVGAAFDFHAGLQPQAPAWAQRRGLEGVFRLCCEPRRLWRRYLLLNPPFFWHRWRERRHRR
ncbi:MAG: WecB/TagA/CpsF family glycosyltransferase [Verrucomicrobiota bacterium JB022]|nr:WecB/TagA/CpsF family glycosyltransferase [Verrucomicrobiota bacterium JB022]